ncbi:MAG: glutamate-1-semialdehyde 2,1-aminomutase, partial [Abditibacteriales bacterium]|nr:glutamate-1-semialdehyde 2,1-aminomutase [Abditibacteriales bacterium]MDW8366905.1 glutamate-1-semialdehyde 2,1-aminomutase [Abditibacteriales bacterium]
MKTDKSRQLFEQAQQFIPGGVNSPVRAFKSVGGEPLFIARGEGAYLYDVDGNRYVDYVCSWGPLILGHAPKPVVEAVQDAVTRGTSYGAPTPLEVELAQMICDAVPSIELVRLVNSGTEATMSAIRLARGFTKRNKIVKFDGCYHGHADALLVAAGSGVMTLGIPGSPGVPESYVSETIQARFNDIDQFREIVAAQGKDIACVIVEPIAGNMGVVPPQPGFLEGLRELTAQHGIVLIFDEVITGFRVAYGGAQELYGVTPDLTTLGKIIGGGFPVGAYGGRRDIMEHIAPAGPVYQAGTLSGNPVAVTAGIAVLKVLQNQVIYAELERKAQRLADGLAEATKKANVPVTCNRVGSMMTTFFTDQPVTDYDSAKTADTQRYAKFFRAMLERGIYLAPSQ